MEIAGNGFLVTGAGSGLGAATAALLAERGGHVVAADVRGGDLRADVTEEADVLAALAAVRERAGGVHGVVNCAGIGTAGLVVRGGEPHPLELFERTLRVNLVGTFNVVRLAAAAMAEQEPTATGERGVVVNTASVAAFEGQVGQAAYAASKGGVAALTLPLARELARHAIRVVAIAPGLFDTPMLAGLDEEVRESLGAQVPFPPRLGRPEEFAALVLHVVENELLNGDVIRLDGALRLPPR